MKPKCPKCGHPLDSYATWRREVESHPFGVACAKCKWVRMVSRAAIIRLATQGKRTCQWRWEPGIAPDPRMAGMFVSCQGVKYFEPGRYCPGCGKPVEVVG